MAIRFDGKVAIVTGAGGGLGRAHALELARRGARVVVNDLGGAVDGSGGSSQAAKDVVAEIKALGGEAVANGGSVGDREGARSIVRDAVDAYGTVDILINNAGILRDKSFAKMALDDFELVLRVHLLGSVYCTQAAWPIMAEKNWGRIVMTTSSSGLYGNFGQSNYAAAKAGLLGLARSAARELGASGVTVNVVEPGFTDTPLTAALPPAVRERALAETPLKRVAHPEDVAEAVFFFAGPGAAHVTGQSLAVDGGQGMGA